MFKSAVLTCLAICPAVLASVMFPAEDRFELARKSSVNLDIVPYAGESTTPEVPAKHGLSLARTDEAVQIGETRYDYQHNGSLGKMLAVSSDGVVHGSFMGGQNVDAERRVEAWCLDPDTIPIGPLNVMDQHAGYTTHAVTSEAPPNGFPPNSGVVAHHTSAPAASWFGVDFGGCTLAFEMFQHEGVDIIWPHIAMDYQDKLHMISGDYNSEDVLYDSSTNPYEVPVWDGGWMPITNNSNTLSYAMTAAKNAHGAAALFMQNAPCGPIAFEPLAPQWHHDVYYVEADAARNDLQQEISAGDFHNVTDYHCEDSSTPFAFGTLAYADMDGIYDRQVDPQLHIAWPTPVSLIDTMLYEVNDTTFYFLFANVNMHSAIWHYNVDTEAWSHIAGWLTGDGEDDAAPDPGVFRVSQDRPQLGVDGDSGLLYAVWNVYSDDDRAAEWGGNEMPNGEIYAACSADNGQSWGPRVNLTNTPTPGCEAPDCLSETFASLAEDVRDGYLHISYLEDLHAGSFIRADDENDGSEETINPWVYMRVPVEDVPPHDGTPWDAEGHIGLVDYRRTWWFTDGHPETVRIMDKIHVFNECREAVRLDSVIMYHDPLDDFSGEFEAGWEMLLGEDGSTGSPMGNCEYIGLPTEEDWDGWIPARSVALARVWVDHSAYPLQEQAFKFSFGNGTERVYRYEYRAAEGQPPLVEEIDIDNLEQYERLVFWAVAVEDAPQPAGFHLVQNFPNPFNPSTEIRFELEAPAHGSLKVYNLQGQEVAVLKEGSLSAGSHQVVFDASGLSSGVYFCTLEVGAHSATRKMLLVR